MIKSFEPVYKELEYMFIQLLPNYIEKINKAHNDGIIIKSFTNKTLDEECLRTPYFRVKLEESEYSEKDRIIENTIFICSFEIKLQPTENKNLFFWRYIEAINKMLIEKESDIIISKINANKILLRITLS